VWPGSGTLDVLDVDVYQYQFDPIGVSQHIESAFPVTIRAINVQTR